MNERILSNQTDLIEKAMMHNKLHSDYGAEYQNEWQHSDYLRIFYFLN